MSALSCSHSSLCLHPANGTSHSDPGERKEGAGVGSKAEERGREGDSMSNALERVCQEVNHLVLQGSLYRNKIWLFGDITLFGPTRSAIGKDMQPTISFLWNEDQGSCSLSSPLQRNHHHPLINCNTMLSTTETTNPCTRKVRAIDWAMYPNWVG